MKITTTARRALFLLGMILSPNVLCTLFRSASPVLSLSLPRPPSLPLSRPPASISRRPAVMPKAAAQAYPQHQLLPPLIVRGMAVRDQARDLAGDTIFGLSAGHDSVRHMSVRDIVHTVLQQGFTLWGFGGFCGFSDV